MNRALGIGLLAGSFSSGCGECDAPLPPAPDTTVDPTAPPRLVAARFLDRTTIELSFTEPLAPPTGVDPTKFRLSIAEAYAFHEFEHSRCFRSTNYFDLSDGLGVYVHCEPTDPQCTGPLTSVSALSLDPEDPERLRLTITPELDLRRCDQLRYSETGGIFVHFSAAAIPTITDADNQPLDDIASHWALSSERNLTRDAIFPAMDAFVPIPCPGA